MSIIECNVRTTTLIKNGVATISCISEEEQNGVSKPTVYRSDIPDAPLEINKTEGKEGELLLTHTDSGEGGYIDKNGNLIISVKDDEADRYSINENGELIYDGQ